MSSNLNHLLTTTQNDHTIVNTGENEKIIEQLKEEKIIEQLKEEKLIEQLKEELDTGYNAQNQVLEAAGGRKMDWRLSIRQEPIQARMCGLKDKVAKRILDPPLVLELDFPNR